MAERTPYERETLVFENAEQAHAFSERVAERIRSEHVQDVDKRREIVAEEVAKEFEKEGEGVTIIKEPWSHSPDEHRETQELVDIAFERDLRSAIQKAQQGNHYPRNIDLMHDVITTQMYELIVQAEMNQEQLTPWLFLILGMMLLALSIVVVLLML